MTVIFPIETINDIDVIIDNISEYINTQNGSDTSSNRNMNSNNSSSSSTSSSTRIDMYVGMKREDELSLVIRDIDLIVGEFEDSLEEIWNISSSNSIQLSLVELELSSTISSTDSTSSTNTLNISVFFTTDEDSAQRNGDSSRFDKFASDLKSLVDNESEVILLCIFGFGFIIIVFGLIDSKIWRHNELFKVTIMFSILMHFCDVVSDVLFVLQVFVTWYYKSVIFSFILIFGILFLVVPSFVHFYQLHKSIKLWMTDIETKKVVQAWVQLHLRFLYVISLLLGSSISAVDLCNTNLFHLKIFNMGLNRLQRSKFKNKRIFSTVLLEVTCG